MHNIYLLAVFLTYLNVILSSLFIIYRLPAEPVFRTRVLPVFKVNLIFTYAFNSLFNIFELSTTGHPSFSNFQMSDF